jgi:hypothetical protein
MNRMMLAFAGAVAVGTLASPNAAAAEPRTKLVRCGEQSCLRITGHRDDPTSIVSINGHAVAAEGERRWTVELPVEIVRAWSIPNARTIEVSLGDQQPAITSIDLPIGLLADQTALAELVITVG